MKKISYIFIFLFPFILFNSCTEDMNEITEIKEQGNTNYQRLNIKELPMKLKTHVENIDINSTGSGLQKINISTIDTDNILLFEKENGEKSYNFLLIKPIESNYVLKNYVLIEYPDGSLFELLVKYIPSNGEYFSDLYDFVGQIEYYNLEGELIASLKVDIPSNLNIVYTEAPFNGCNADNLNIQVNGSTATLTLTGNCGSVSWSFDTGQSSSITGGTSGSNDGNWNPNDGGSSGVGSNSNGTSVSPNIPTDDRVMESLWTFFIGTLSPEQFNFLESNELINNQFFYYLEENEFQMEHKENVRNWIDYLIEHPWNAGVGDDFLEELREEYIDLNIDRGQNFENSKADCILSKLLNNEFINNNSELEDIVQDLLWRFTSNERSIRFLMEDLRPQYPPHAVPDAHTVKGANNEFQIVLNSDVLSDQKNPPVLLVIQVLLHELIHVNMLADLEDWNMVTSYDSEGFPRISHNLCNSVDNTSNGYVNETFFQINSSIDDLDRAHFFAEMYCRWKNRYPDARATENWPHRIFERWYVTGGSEMDSFRLMLEQYLLEFINTQQPSLSTSLSSNTNYNLNNEAIAEFYSWRGLTRTVEFAEMARSRYPGLYANVPANIMDMTDVAREQLYFNITYNRGDISAKIHTHSIKINNTCPDE